MKRTKNLMALFMLLFLCSWSAEPSAPIKVSGIVKSAADGNPLPGVAVSVKGSRQGVTTNFDGKFELEVPSEKSVLVFSFVGFVNQEEKVGQKRFFEVSLAEDVRALQEVVVMGGKPNRKIRIRGMSRSVTEDLSIDLESKEAVRHNTEEYATIHENIFLEAVKNPLSTFSIDVDNASYSNMRRYILNGQQPPKDAVRIEEMINYFTYEYPQPKEEHPILFP